MQLAPCRCGYNVYRETNSSGERDCHLELASCSLRSAGISLAETCLRAVGLPQSGRSCSEVESELHVARGEIERNKVTGGVTVMAVVEYHAVRGCRF